MKGFLACVLAAIPDFLAQPLRMPLHLAFSYDEEVGCLGVRSLVAHLQASAEKPAMCIIGEPTEMRPVYGHKGKLAMRCDVHGHACHSAYAPDGVNAIAWAAKLIGRLDELGEQLALRQDTRFDPPFSTLQVGVIKGGAALNIVPQHCQFDFEIRHLPDVSLDDTLASLQAYAEGELLPKMRATAAGSAITFQPLSQYPGLLSDRSRRSPAGWRSGPNARIFQRSLLAPKADCLMRPAWPRLFVVRGAWSRGIRRMNLLARRSWKSARRC